MPVILTQTPVLSRPHLQQPITVPFVCNSPRESPVPSPAGPKLQILPERFECLSDTAWWDANAATNVDMGKATAFSEVGCSYLRQAHVFPGHVNRGRNREDSDPHIRSDHIMVTVSWLGGNSLVGNCSAWVEAVRGDGCLFVLALFVL